MARERTEFCAVRASFSRYLKVGAVVESALAERLPDWLLRRADSHGQQIAIQTDDESVSYRELWQMATRLAGTFRTLGVDAGCRVAIAARHGLWFARAVHAVMQCDAVLVPLNTRLTPAELAWQLHDAGVVLFLHDEAHTDLANEANRLLSEPVRLWNLHKDPIGETEIQRPYVDMTRTHSIIYTSGTTGHPKGTQITNANFFWSAMGSAVQLGLVGNDKWLVPMPLFHVGGLSVLMRSVIYGITAYVQDAFQVDRVMRAIEQEGVTLVSVVPTMLQRMVDQRGDTPFPAHLRCVLLGGSAATKTLLERCQDLRIPVAQSYGLTEATSQVATLSPADGLRKLGSSGKPLLPTEIAIWADENQTAVPGQAGEIVVRGPTITPGYFHRPDATDQAWRNGWFHTGDIGYLDPEGYLYVLDRRSDMIVSGGENIYPAEVENAISAHPAVQEAGVAGQADPEWGSVPIAFVKLREGIDVAEEALLQFCRERLAKYKVPRRVVWVDALPRNASGKLMRRHLREWL